MLNMIVCLMFVPLTVAAVGHIPDKPLMVIVYIGMIVIGLKIMREEGNENN